MRAPILALALALTTIPAVADSIPPTEARTHVGQNVTVEGVVSGVHHVAPSKVTFIDLGGRYPNNALTCVILKTNAAKFPDVDTLDGKTIEVSGTVTLYKKEPQIILNDAAQIKVKQ